MKQKAPINTVVYRSQKSATILNQVYGALSVSQKEIKLMKAKHKKMRLL